MGTSTGVIIVLVLLLIMVVLWLSDTPLRQRAHEYRARYLPATGPATPAVEPPVVLKPASQSSTEGFCPKLIQRYGFCDAGEKMDSRRGTFYDNTPISTLPIGGKRGAIRYEGFHTGPAYNTMWADNMHASTLPI
jgi:hypothetical protein